MQQHTATYYEHRRQLVQVGPAERRLHPGSPLMIISHIIDIYGV